MNRIRLFFNRLSEVRHATGTFRAFLIAPLWLVRRRHVVLEMEIPASAVPRVENEPEIEWRQLDEPELGSVVEMNPSLDPELVAARFREGHALFACLVEGRIVHYRWYASTRSWLPFLRLSWEPETGDYTVVGAYTHPRERNRGVNTAVLRQGLERASALGYRRVVSFIAEWNAPSLKATKRGGLRPIGSVTLWTFGIVHWHTSTGRARVEGGTLRVQKV